MLLWRIPTSRKHSNRGLSSRSAGTGPLYVVDGIPGADMTNINPADIAWCVEGMNGICYIWHKGGNGVIIVNLKKGSKDGNVHTNYSSSFTLNVPKQELEMLTAEQFRLYRAYNNPSLDLGANTDWLKASMRTGYQHMHTLSFSGGNVKTNYRATVDFRDARGVDLRSTRREYGSRVTINHTTWTLCRK